MNKHNENIYMFCEQNLTAYEKTIYTLAIAYGEAKPFELNNETIFDIARLLNLDDKLLMRAVSGDISIVCNKVVIRFGADIVDCTEFFDPTLFQLLVYSYWAYKELDNITEPKSDKELRNNIQILERALSFLESTNASMATYECLKENKFSFKHIVYDYSVFSPKEYIKYLQLIISEEDLFVQNKSLSYVVLLLVQYELKTRVKAIYLILITRIIMDSPYFDKVYNEIAKEMHEHLIFILKNGRVVSIQVNSLFFDLDICAENRSKKENTTRLQILYGYENYDTYIMRVDLAHCGQPFAHFNNASPGKVCSYVLTKNEYEDILLRHPMLANCFVEYSNERWALKERRNCELDKRTAEILDIVEKQREHKRIFEQEYSESMIVAFVDIFSNMLPARCLVPIDIDGEHARGCFNYDILMRNTSWLFFAYINQNIELMDLISDDIVKKAYNYGIISEHEMSAITSLEDICYILFRAEEKINSIT